MRNRYPFVGCVLLVIVFIFIFTIVQLYANATGQVNALPSINWVWLSIVLVILAVIGTIYEVRNDETNEKPVFLIIGTFLFVFVAGALVSVVLWLIANWGMKFFL